MKIKMLFLPLICFLLVFSCNGRNLNLNQAESNKKGSRIEKAERFRLNINDSLTELLIINPWQGAINVNQKYFLIKRGDGIPPGIDSSSVIFVPVKRIICMATSHAAMISALGEEKSVCGISGGNLVFDDKFEKLIANKTISEVGYDANLNMELILNLAPDLIMMYGIGSESEGYVNKMKELGLKVIFNADYLETDPLARAEWIKFFGALYNKTDLADSIYNAEISDYDKLKSIIQLKSETRPKVMTGLPFRDTWYISPGNSYMSKLIDDAGGSYIWSDKVSSVSIPMGLENVFFRAINADFWLNIGTVKTKNEINLADSRLTELECYRNGNLFNNNKAVKNLEANDYWERGMLHPHLLLKDMASIFHPGLFGEEELVFYKKIN